MSREVEAGRHRVISDANRINGELDAFVSRIQSPNLRRIAFFWRQVRGSERMPRWKDMSVEALAPYAKILWGFAYDRKTGMFTGRLAGGKLSRWVGDNFNGGCLQDLHLPENYRDAQQILTKIVTTPLAFRSSGRLFMVDDFVVTGERIVLPLATDGENGDAVIGVSDYVAPPLLGPPIMLYENIEWYDV